MTKSKLKKVAIKKEPKKWSPHKYLVAAARKTWRWSPERREVLAKARMEKGLYQCQECLRVVGIVDYLTNRKRKRRKIDGAIDHITPIGKGPREWSEYEAWYKKLFCPVENLQFLCTACHLEKTTRERGERSDR